MSKTPIPFEYQDCVLSPALASIFESNPDWQSLLMIGPAGTGKTTQMYALADDWSTESGKDWVKIISECMDISRNWKDYEELQSWINWYGILCVDDIGYAKPTEWCRDAVYAIATERRKHGLQTIWSTNLNLEQLAEAYSPAIASRLQGGQVLDTAGEDKRQKFIASPTSVQRRREAREAREAAKEAEEQAEREIQKMLTRYIDELATQMDVTLAKLDELGITGYRRNALTEILNSERLITTRDALVAQKVTIQSDDGQQVIRQLYRIIKVIDEFKQEGDQEWPDDIQAIIPEIRSGARS